MPNHKSASKRMLQNEKRRVRNRHYKSRVKNRVGIVREAIENNNLDQLTEKLRTAISEIAHAQTKGVIPARRASRKISRLTRAVNKAISPTASEG